MKRLVLLVVILLVPVLGILFGKIWLDDNLSPVATNRGSVVLVVVPNEAASVTLEKLQNSGLIKSVLAARIHLKIFRNNQRILPGSYIIPTDTKFVDILSLLSKGPRDVWVTFLEGWRVEQYAKKLQDQFPNFATDRFLSLAQKFEGQLFPDTYLVPQTPAPEMVLSLLQGNFQSKSGLKLDTTYSIPASEDSVKITGVEVLTIASLIEREARIDSERTLIASVLYNRLLANMPLQIDATVQYAVDSKNCSRAPLDCQYWEPIFDTKFPSVMNTYLNQGLPPKPIANPGISSIKAAMDPEVSDYYYYMTGNDGVTRFARTLREHNLNVDKYLRS